jgi:predicted DNA-binding protein (UPF0251 family)
MFVGVLKTLTVEQLIKMAIDKYKSVKLAAKVLDISQPSMSRKYKKNREKMVYNPINGHLIKSAP